MFPAYHVFVSGCVCAVHDNFLRGMPVGGCWGGVLYTGVAVSRLEAAARVVVVVLVPLAPTQILVLHHTVNTHCGKCKQRFFFLSVTIVLFSGLHSLSFSLSVHVMFFSVQDAAVVAILRFFLRWCFVR